LPDEPNLWVGIGGGSPLVLFSLGGKKKGWVLGKKCHRQVTPLGPLSANKKRSKLRTLGLHFRLRVRPGRKRALIGS